jgi:hypothetical protein
MSGIKRGWPKGNGRYSSGGASRAEIKEHLTLDEIIGMALGGVDGIPLRSESSTGASRRSAVDLEVRGGGRNYDRIDLSFCVSTFSSAEPEKRTRISRSLRWRQRLNCA